MEEYGFFKAGGVLISTHAFACYANMLGVSWFDADRTPGVDSGYAAKNVSLALSSDFKLDLQDTISSLETGFLPMAKLGDMAGGSHISPQQPDFHLKWITPVGRDPSDLVNLPILKTAMVPHKFIEYSLQDIHQAALLSEEGALLVNVPHPARYALHKLLVAGERGPSFRTKSSNDLRQSAALLQFYAAHQPGELMHAWENLQSRGNEWQSQFAIGVDMLKREVPGITESLIWSDKIRGQAD